MQKISAKQTRTLRRMVWIAAAVFACILFIAKWLTGSDIASAARERKKAGLEIRSDALIARCNEALADDGVEILADGYWKAPGPPYDLYIRNMSTHTEDDTFIAFSLTGFSRIWPPMHADLPVHKVIISYVVPKDEAPDEIPVSLLAMLDALYEIYTPDLASHYPQESRALLDMQMRWFRTTAFDESLTVTSGTSADFSTKMTFDSAVDEESGTLMKIMTLHTCTPSCRE